MPLEHAVLFEENPPVPRDAFTLEGFRRWVASAEFPETGRIDFLAGDVEVELSPEELFSHGLVKGAIYAGLHNLLSDLDIGEAFIDSTRYTSDGAGLSAEPDVVVVLYDSLDAGRVRYRSLGRRPDRLSEIEGAADLVVEVVSDDSVTKDTRRLPHLYAQAGVPELWLVDARGNNLRFQAFSLRAGSYLPAEPDSEGWIWSEGLRHFFRLTRRATPRGTWRYALEKKGA
jgi:Uma2 family endonuclease